jgi:hypothetical protein
MTVENALHRYLASCDALGGVDHAFDRFRAPSPANVALVSAAVSAAGDLARTLSGWSKDTGHAGGFGGGGNAEVFNTWAARRRRRMCVRCLTASHTLPFAR